MRRIGTKKLEIRESDYLSGLSEIIANIKKFKGVDIDLTNLPMDDEKTFKMLGNAGTVRIPWLNKPSVRLDLKRIKPTCFDDIFVIIAFYLAGLSNNIYRNFADYEYGPQIFTYNSEVNESLKDILSETYGVLVFKEQVQLVLGKLAGISLLQANNLLQKFLGSEDFRELEEDFETLKEGMLTNGYSEQAIEAICFDFLTEAKNTISRVEAVNSAMFLYQVSYLKANYPEEYYISNRK